MSDIHGEDTIIDLRGRILAPGFIDTQINGGGGVLFNNNPTIDALKTISKAHERFGVLNFCPTIISTDMDTIKSGLDAVRLAQTKNIGVLGAHLEGPFLERAKAGIHKKECIRSASDHEINEIINHSDGSICIMTIAPEAITLEQIKFITQSGVRVFIGHTNATCEQALGAFRSGAIGVTHLYNAMSQLGSREPGVVGATFVSPDAWAGIVVDGHHVNYQSVRIAKAIKKSRLFLVTDAMPPVGKPVAKYQIGDFEISCIGGRCATSDGMLAGSALDMAAAVRNAVQKCGISPDEAIRMASTYVAEMLGISDLFGAIKPGLVADMVVLNERLHVEAIVRQGEYHEQCPML